MYGVGKISDIFAGRDIDESFPTKSNVEGISQTVELLQKIDEGFVFVNLVETDHALGAPQRPGELPPLPAGLRPAAAGHPRSAASRAISSIITSDHGCDPTTPSTDHSREHALLLAYAAGRNAAGRVHEEGEFARRRCDRERLARRQGAREEAPGPPDRAVRLDDPALVARQYATERGSRARVDLRRRRRASDAARRRVRCGRRGRAATRARGRLRAGASSPSASRASSAPRSSRSTCRRGWSSWPRARRRRARRRRAGAAVRGRLVRLSPSPPGCSSTCPTSTAGSRSSHGSCGPAAVSSRSRTASDHLPSCANSSGRGMPS